MRLWGTKHGEVCLTPEMTAHHGSPSTSVYLSGHGGEVFPLCKERAARGPLLACQAATNQSRACSASGPHQSHCSPSYFPALLSGSLTRLSSLSSFAISTSGPFLTSWPFFACEESKQGRAVSREDHGDGEVSGAGRDAGLLCPSSQPSLGADPQGDAPACLCISSPSCHEMCKDPVGWGRAVRKGLGGDGSGSVGPQ